MRVWNALSAASLILLITLSQIQGSEIKGPPIDGGTSPLPASEEGRALFDFGIFKRISQFFGWGKGTRKKSRQSPIHRRPEMLPFELYSQNRRSGFDPHPDFTQGGDFIDPRPKKWAFKRHHSQSSNRQRVKSPFFKRVPPVHVSSFKALPENYKPLMPHNNAKSHAHFKDILNDNSIKLDRTGQRQYLFSENDSQPLVKTAKIESREPVVAIYSGGEKQQLPPSEKVVTEKKKPVHSKFALKTYAPELMDTLPINPYLKGSQRPKKINSFKSGSENSYMKKENKLQEKEKVFGQKNLAHPYQFVDPYVIRKQTQSHYDEDPLLAQGHGPDPVFATPVRGKFVRPQKQEKEKGFLENVTSMASNFFGNFLSKSSQDTTPSPLKRRHRNPPPRINLASRGPFPRFSSTSSSGSSANNKIGGLFAPSPQQGSNAVAFQPIFVPSHSMDRKLPNDIMKPLIIPQKRTAEAATEAPEPQLIDFF